jgi:hypothetical protein
VVGKAAAAECEHPLVSQVRPRPPRTLCAAAMSARVQPECVISLAVEWNLRVMAVQESQGARDEGGGRQASETGLFALLLQFYTVLVCNGHCTRQPAQPAVIL